MSSYLALNILTHFKIEQDKEVAMEIAGMLTGIIASAIFAGIVWIIKKSLWPMYISAIYKGTKIDGKWDVYYEGNEKPSAEISFTQKGTEIRGYSVVYKDTEGNSVDRHYLYRGTFLNRSIVLTFEDKNNPLMLGGAMVFHHIDADGKHMKGKSMYFKQQINDVAISQATLIKKGS